MSVLAGRRRRFRLLVLCGVVAAVLAVTPVANAAPSPPPFDVQAQVVAVYRNSANDDVPYRRGWYGPPSSGFGRDKVTQKHRITNDRVVEFLLRFPEATTHLGGQRWNHTKTLTYRTCAPEIPYCYEVDSRVLVLSVDYSDFRGFGRLGVVTVYCQNPDRAAECPAWINDVQAYGSDLGVIQQT